MIEKNQIKGKEKSVSDDVDRSNNQLHYSFTTEITFVKVVCLLLIRMLQFARGCLNWIEPTVPRLFPYPGRLPECPRLGTALEDGLPILRAKGS